MSYLVVTQHSAFEIGFTEFDSYEDAKKDYDRWSDAQYSLVHVFLTEIKEKV